MKLLFDITTDQSVLFLVGLVVLVLFLYLFYWIIKEAVKNGYKEARNQIEIEKSK